MKHLDLGTFTDTTDGAGIECNQTPFVMGDDVVLVAHQSGIGDTVVVIETSPDDTVWTARLTVTLAVVGEMQVHNFNLADRWVRVNPTTITAGQVSIGLLSGHS